MILWKVGTNCCFKKKWCKATCEKHKGCKAQQTLSLKHKKKQELLLLRKWCKATCEKHFGFYTNTLGGASRESVRIGLSKEKSTTQSVCFRKKKLFVFVCCFLESGAKQLLKNTKGCLLLRTRKEATQTL